MGFQQQEQHYEYIWTAEFPLTWNTSQTDHKTSGHLRRKSQKKSTIEAICHGKIQCFPRMFGLVQRSNRVSL